MQEVQLAYEQFAAKIVDYIPTPMGEPRPAGAAPRAASAAAKAKK
jgi:hypothetical protein